MSLLSGSSATPLCFSREDFARSDFNVETFLGSLRRRVAIEQIQEDLRTYLRILQNAMIELINKDYADFVNLSSNLVNLRVTLEKLGKDVASVSQEFATSTRELESALESLSGFLAAKNSSRKVQMKLEQKSQLFTSFSRIDWILRNRESNRNVIERVSQLLAGARIKMKLFATGEERKQWDAALHKLSEEFQILLDCQLLESVRNEDSGGFRKALDGYEACDRRDAALALFMSEFVKPSLTAKLDVSSRIPHEKLEAVFARLFQTWDEHSAFLSGGQRELDFVNDSLLTVLLDILDTDFANLLIPTDPTEFHKSYTALAAFVRKWNAPRHSLLRMASKKFSLTVYFRLRCQELTRGTEKILLSTSTLSTRDSACLLEATHSTVTSIGALWADSVYLPELTPKFWDTTCKLIAQYRGWLERVIKLAQEVEEPKKTTEEDGKLIIAPVASTNNMQQQLNGKTESWKDMIRLVVDGVNVESLVFEVAFEAIWPKIRNLGGDTNEMGRCLSSAFSSIKAVTGEGIRAVTASLATEMSSALAVSMEIPRQYRWTRKEAPSQPSAYVATAFEALSAFGKFAEENLMPEESQQEITEGVLRKAGMEDYLQNVRNVLDSVDKISSSLTRLKKGSTARLNTSADTNDPKPMTDDQKIRQQLWLDLTDFKERALGFLLNENFDWTPLDELLEVAGKSETA